MKTEDEIIADFWTQKTNWLKNVLRYGAPAFEIDVLYNALLEAGFEAGTQIRRTVTRSFFGNECPALQLSLCTGNDIVITQNPGINTLSLNVQLCREPVLLTGATPESAVNLVRTYMEHFPRYKEALDMLLENFRRSAKEDAKRQKLKKLALANIHLVIAKLFAGSPYHPYLKTEENRAVLAVRLQSGKTLEIRLPYENFQNSLEAIHDVIAQMERETAKCPLDINITDTDYWNGEGFVADGSPNK